MSSKNNRSTSPGKPSSAYTFNPPTTTTGRSTSSRTKKKPRTPGFLDELAYAFVATPAQRAKIDEKRRAARAADKAERRERRRARKDGEKKDKEYGGSYEHYDPGVKGPAAGSSWEWEDWFNKGGAPAREFAGSEKEGDLGMAGLHLGEDGRSTERSKEKGKGKGKGVSHQYPQTRPLPHPSEPLTQSNVARLTAARGGEQHYKDKGRGWDARPPARAGSDWGEGTEVSLWDCSERGSLAPSDSQTLRGGAVERRPGVAERRPGVAERRPGAVRRPWLERLERAARGKARGEGDGGGGDGE